MIVFLVMKEFDKKYEKEYLWSNSNIYYYEKWIWDVVDKVIFFFFLKGEVLNYDYYN